jgi:hypothetical protein
VTPARSIATPKSHPLLFSAPMIRALLDGTKTVTRRVVKRHARFTERQWAAAVPNNNTPGNGAFELFGSTYLMVPAEDWITGGRIHPPWLTGDRLWVRETFGRRDDGRVYFAADETLGQLLVDRWKPSIHMPRAASRITLEITDVRVERLHAITEEGAKAEGARWTDFGQHTYEMSVDFGATYLPAKSQNAGWSMFPVTRSEQCLGTARMAFANAWNRIHGGERWNLKDTPSPWDLNPWVWALTFRRVTR